MNWKLLHGSSAMDPDTVHNAQPEHNHEYKRTAVTDQRQRHSGNRQHGNRHAHILENVRKDECGHPNGKEQTELIAGKEGHEKAGQNEQSESANEEHSADKSPLLADGGKNIVVMHGGGGQKSKFDLGVGSLETFSGPSSGTDR